MVAVWDLRSPQPAAQVPASVTGERIYALSAAGSVLAAGTAERRVLMWDLRAGLGKPLHNDTSPLTHQTRALALSASGAHWAVASVAGRIVCLPTDAAAAAAGQSAKVSFNCHRTDARGATAAAGTLQFPVNALAWCPGAAGQHLLASGGGDGSWALWDVAKRQQVAGRAALGAGVTALAWSHDGSHVAYAVGEDWSTASYCTAPPAPRAAELRLSKVM